LDYRIPVYREVNQRLDGQFALFYNADYVPDRCCRKAQEVLGAGAKGLRGEWAVKWGMQNGFANRGMRIPYQPGLIKAILDEKPDVIITDGFFQWTYAALWLRARKGIPHVMCYERTHHTERKAQRYRTTYRKMTMKWIDAICCSGSLCGQYVCDLGFPKERLTYGHMVADVSGLLRATAQITQDEVQRLKSRLALRGLVYIYVGQLIARKGVSELLKGWRAFSDRVPQDQATLLLVGDGPQRSELECCCRKEQLENVVFAGAVNYDHLPVYYRSADAFIIPTIEDNWSLVVPEAMACGLPIICSKYNGCYPELVTPNNGWVLDPLSVDDVAGVLHRCFLDSSVLPGMGRVSRETVISQYTASTAAKAVLQACNRVHVHAGPAHTKFLFR
jgi:glycosyltransferase involved in cell wall biosynthesis